MLSLKEQNNYLVIQNSYYTAKFNKRRGYSLESLIYKGIDTKLYREGCEFWCLDNKTHFEQEFGGEAIYKILEQSKKEIIIEIESFLGYPKKENAGKCKIQWIFNDTPVLESISSILPNFNIDCARDDRYVCFKANTYSDYCYYDGNIEWKPIKQNLVKGSKQQSWGITVNFVKNILIKNKNNGILFIADSRLYHTIVYHSYSMCEIKSQGPYKNTYTNIKIIPFLNESEIFQYLEN